MLSRDLPYIVAFHTVPGMTYKYLAAIRRVFPDVSWAWEKASASDFLEAKFPQELVTSILSHRRALYPSEYMERLYRQRIQICTIDDPAYPKLLAEIPQPPLIVYYKGNLPREELCVAVVGTRLPSEYGRRVARSMAGGWSRMGWTIVSGLAKGIDGVAHEAALEEQGRTIAVFGCGLDYIYPQEHIELAEKIAARGALISEFPLGTEPRPYFFPQRNRIISGLSKATIVIEAAEKSGALTTAHIAFEQNRDVFAIPGNLTSPQSRGTNRLLQEQIARPLLHPEDLELLLQEEAGQMPLWNEKEGRILTAIDKKTKTADDIAEETRLPIELVLATLTSLELSGEIQRKEGDRFMRCS